MVLGFKSDYGQLHMETQGLEVIRVNLFFLSVLAYDQSH